MSEQVLVLDEISKRFEGKTAVDSLSAEFTKGCIYGFLGPNGAGKTTTIRMIMDIIRPDSGSIKLLEGIAPGEGKDRIGYLPEERGMYRKMKAADFLGFIGRLKGMSDQNADSSASNWLKILELDSRGQSKIEEYSRGMQQKLQFAATLINDPELLILDEPFSGLDPVNLEVIKEQILMLRDKGTSIVLSTHMMEHAEKLCDRIILIDKGCKLFDGTLDEIRKHGAENVLLLETDASEEELCSIEGVESVVRDRDILQVILDENIQQRQFLSKLLMSHEVRSFRVRTPSLHETFISMVSGSGGKDA